MARHIRLRELLVGIEGLALLRHLYEGTDEDAERRLSEVRRLLDDDAFSASEAIGEVDPRSGYRSWSQSYDEPGNPIIAVEEPVVRSLVDGIAPGRALDAACGTGRHARYLADRGHEVLGIDLTPEMLAQASANVPAATFAQADLRDIPAQDESFDLVVCGLALAHLDELAPAVAELVRVLKRHGRLVVSVLHPLQAQLGWNAPFTDQLGRRGFVREHAHTHSDYLTAFRSAGVQLRGCVEPKLTLDHVRSKRRAFEHVPEATAAAYVGLPAALVLDFEKS
jgi:SAM-dependent methyltransferase